MSLILSVGIILIFIWGVDVQNFAIFIGGVITIIAVGFFAVWSLLSNVIAALILFVTHPFRIGDQIRILPDGISGEVLDVSLFFTILQGKKGKIHIPNNIMLQRVIVKER